MSSILKCADVYVNREKSLIYSTNTASKINKNKTDFPVIPEVYKDNIAALTNSARCKATKIIEEAQLQAKEILSNAHEEADTIKTNAKEDGYGEGYHNGYQQGILEGQNEFKAMINEINNLKTNMIAEKETLYMKSEKELLELSLEIAEKIIGTHLEKPEGFLDIAKRALNSIKDKSNIQLRISTLDFPAISENKDVLLSMVEGLQELSIIQDPSLEKGSCVIDTGFGVVDAGIPTQMQQVRNIFSSASD